MKILVVDDDEVQRRLIKAQIRRAGHEVVEASSGEAAWEIVQNETIQFVITDWLMPGLSGVELTGLIRQAHWPFYTYVILLSVRADRDDVIDGLVSGVDDYLAKPWDSRELWARVEIGMRILSLESQLRESVQELHRLATRDTLTGLFNRRAVYEFAEAEAERARRQGSPLSLALLDIDHFKQINDHHGHVTGDQALKLASATIIESIRSYDQVGRWGGEEFLIVLPETTLGDAAHIAERVRTHVATTGMLLDSGERLFMQVSVGVAGSDQDAPLPVDMLINQADNALYQAKHEGRNRVCLASPRKAL